MGDPVETRNAWVVGHKTPGQTYHFQGINQGIVTPNMVENSEQNLKPPTRYIEDMGTLYIYLVGGFNSSEKYESQLGLLFPIYGKKCSEPPTSYI